MVNTHSIPYHFSQVERMSHNFWLYFSLSAIAASVAGNSFPHLFLAFADGPPALQKDNRPIAGRVVSASGTVISRFEPQSDVKSVTDKSRPFTLLKPGMLVFQGDVINTSSNSFVKVLLEDKTILDIGPTSLFHIKTFEKNHGNDRNVDTSMMYGTVRAAVSQKIEGGGKFRIKTSTVTMGVRGTEFVVKTSLNNRTGQRDSRNESGKPAHDRPNTEITVLQGRVDVAKNIPTNTRGLAADLKIQPVVSLTAGQKINASAETALPKQAIELNQLQQATLKSSATVVDNTFSHAITFTSEASEKKDSGAGGGQAMATVIRETVAQAAAPQTAAAAAPAASASTNSGFIGTFGATTGLQPTPVVVPAGGLKHLRVVILR